MLKYFNKKRNKGQSTLEYAVLIIIIIGAVLVMQNYIKRGISGRLKSATDDIGDQYSQGNTNVVTYRSTSSSTRDTFIQGETKSVLLGDEISTEISNSNIMNQQFEFWGKG